MNLTAPPRGPEPTGERPRRRHETTRAPQPVTADVYRRRRLTVAAGLIAVLVLGIVAVQQVRGGSSAAAPTPTAAPLPVETAPPTTVAAEQIEPAACMLEVPEVAVGDTGTDVECAQRALRAAGVMDSEVTGTFDSVTQAATRSFQAELGLYVDGIIGKNTATELGIWPGAESFIVRTPAPPEGAVDLIGMPLSSVASAGDDAPPLPDGASMASGKRVVYDRAGQRVWAIDDEERIVRSYLVSGSQFRNEVPGIHTVYSKSEMALGWDLQADLPYMVRYTQTERGHIGFHAIPSWNDTGEALQTEDELGQKLSGGCTRQALLDAQFMYQFADVGTTVIVL